MNHSTWKGSHYEGGLRYGATLYERRINLMEHLTVDQARLDLWGPPRPGRRWRTGSMNTAWPPV